MAGDLMQGVINKFAALMVCVAFVAVVLAGLVGWGLWWLMHRWFGG